MTLDISQKVRDDLRDVAGSPGRRREGLEEVQPRGALAAKRGVGEPKAPASTSGGVASPFTEKTKVEGGKTVPDREYWPQGHLSSDGLFVWPAWKRVNMTDANGDDVVFDFANPSETL